MNLTIRISIRPRGDRVAVVVRRPGKAVRIHHIDIEDLRDAKLVGPITEE